MCRLFCFVVLHVTDPVWYLECIMQTLECHIIDQQYCLHNMNLNKKTIFYTVKTVMQGHPTGSQKVIFMTGSLSSGIQCIEM